MTASTRRPSARYSHNIPKAFLEGSDRMLFRQNMRNLWYTPKLSRKFVQKWIFLCCATAKTKTAVVILHVWLNYFAASFFKSLGIYLCREVKERYVPVAIAFTPVSLLVCQVITPEWQYFGAIPEYHAPRHVRESAKELFCSRIWTFRAGFHHNLQPSVFWQLWIFQMVFSSPKCTSCVSDDVRANMFKISLKYSLHLLRISSSLLSKAQSWSLMDLTILDLLSQRRRVFVGTLCSLASYWNWVYVENSPKLAVWTFLPRGLRTFAPQRAPNAKKVQICSEASSGGEFICSSSIFHLLAPPR